MQNQHKEKVEVRAPAIERIPAAASRMGISVSGVYREIRALRLGPLVKLGPLASGLPASAVDAWINSKIEAAQKGGR